MFEKELCETYRKCTLLSKTGATAESIVPLISGKDIIFSIKFVKGSFSETALYTCREVSKSNITDHATNVKDLYRVCISATGEVPNILPDYCSVCGKLYFSNNSRFNRVFHTCSKCKIDQCNETLSVETATMNYVYLILCKEDNRVKIGTSTDPQKRLKQLQTGNTKTLSLIGLIKGGFDLEKNIHKLFGDKRIKGEWFEYCNDIESFFDTYKA